MTEHSLAGPGAIAKLVPMVLFALSLSALPGAVGSAQAADTAAGKALARQWCSSCHLVSEEQSSASSVSLPSFFDIAEDPSWTTEKLATFLADPHPKMPNMTLGNFEIANLASYISSLKK
ncbi:MAG: c-type cytochrome [Roseibium sp.]